MMIASVTEFRKDLKTYIDKVIDNVETLVINRGKGKGIVIMSLDEYNAMDATRHELSSEVNAQRLRRSIKEFKEGKSFQKELIEE